MTSRERIMHMRVEALNHDEADREKLEIWEVSRHKDRMKEDISHI